MFAVLSQQPQIILLKEGTDVSQGKAQLISNINACIAVVDVVRTTLGPRGMDKLVHDEKGTTISNDGATIMKLLDIVHPAAKILVDIAKSQDAEVRSSEREIPVTLSCILIFCSDVAANAVMSYSIGYFILLTSEVLYKMSFWFACDGPCSSCWKFLQMCIAGSSACTEGSVE